MHTRVADLNLPAVQQVDDRRIELIANGLSLHNGSQLAIDATLFAPPSSTGQPRRRGGQFAASALHDARRAKERTCPELRTARRCRLAVLAIEVGGRWSTEATHFLRQLAQSRARSVPRNIRAAAITAFIARWSATITHAAMHAFAASLVSLPFEVSTEADQLPLGELLGRGGP